MKNSTLLLIVFLFVSSISLSAQTQKTESDNEYVFLEKAESLKELLKPYNGSPVYIDVWSVYCTNCIKEFKYLQNVSGLLLKKGVKRLYILYTKDFKSEVDQQKNIEKWKKLIKKYDLQGDHYYLTSADVLYKAIQKEIVQGKIKLPWYVLIDKNGSIKNRKAPPCSKLSKLQKEIDALL